MGSELGPSSTVDEAVEAGGGRASGACSGADWGGAAAGRPLFGVGSGAGLANMLAQLLVVPPGMTRLDGRSGAFVFAVIVVVSDARSSPCVPSSDGLPYADDSSVGTEVLVSSRAGSARSLWMAGEPDRCPLVGATEPPRPPRPKPRPRSEPRPRPPRPVSTPPRPPRPARLGVPVKPEPEVSSLALDRDRSLDFFLTSPHCETLPMLTSTED